MKKSLLLAAIAALAGFSSASLSAETVYEKVTPTVSLEEITDGNYIITCPAFGTVMGNLDPENPTNYFPKVNLEGFDANTTTITPSKDYAIINITKVSGGYSIKYGDQYLTQTAINQILLTETAQTATIEYADNKLKIFINPEHSTVGPCYIQYNSNNSVERFASYKTVQKPITLFKEVTTVEPEPDPEPDPVERPEITPDADKGEVLVHVDNVDHLTGSITTGGTGWTSKTTPAFALAFDNNCSFTMSGNGDPVIAANNGTITITSADPAYYVSGYVFRALSADGNEITVEAVAEGGELCGPDEYDYCFAEGIEEGTSVYIIANGTQITFSDIDVILAPVTAEPEPEPARHTLTAGEGDKLVNVPALTDGTLSANGKVWTSNTTPAFTISFDEGNNHQFETAGSSLALVCGNNSSQHATLTVASADPAYFVSGYVFDATGYMGDGVVINFGKEPFTTDGTTKYAWIDPIEEGTAATFTAAPSENAWKKAILSNIDVRFSPATIIPEPEPEPEIIPDPSTWSALDRTGWIVKGCSQHNAGDDGGFNDTIDGNTGTYWHTSWANSTNDNQAPHYLIFDLGEGEHASDGFGYTPRQGTTGNGYITEYAIYITDHIDQTVLNSSCTASQKQQLQPNSHANMESFLAGLTPVVEGTFDFIRVDDGNSNSHIACPTENGNVSRERRVHFDETAKGRYCIFFVKASVGQNAAINHANCAEFNLYTFRKIDHRPEGISWINNMIPILCANLPIFYSEDDAQAAKDAVNALAEDATSSEVMAAAYSLYDAANGKLFIAKNLQYNDYLAYLEESTEHRQDYTPVHDALGVSDDPADLASHWSVEHCGDGKYLIKNYLNNRYAGFNTTENHAFPTSETAAGAEPYAIEKYTISGQTVYGFKAVGSQHAHPYMHQIGDQYGNIIVCWNMPNASIKPSGWLLSTVAEEGLAVELSASADKNGITFSVDGDNLVKHAAYGDHHVITVSKRQMTRSISEPASFQLGNDAHVAPGTDGTYAVTYDGELEEGTYDVTVPAHAFKTENGKVTAPAQFTLTVDQDGNVNTTGINVVEATAPASFVREGIYDLQGRRLSAPVKGINIINGRKVLVK